MTMKGLVAMKALKSPLARFLLRQKEADGKRLARTIMRALLGSAEKASVEHDGKVYNLEFVPKAKS